MFTVVGATKVAAIAGMFILGLFGAGPDGAPEEDDKIASRLYEAIQGLPETAMIDVIVEADRAGPEAADAARGLGLDVVWEYTIIDAFSARVAVGDLDTLTDQPWVLGVWDSAPTTTLMDVSTSDIEADRAWDAGYTGAGVTVAVLDTGIDVLDPAFSGRLAACVSTVAGFVIPECDDTDGHGTHVAGTVAARHATYGGVAPDAELAVVRVLHAAGAGTSADVIAGMDWVVRNKDRVEPAIQVATMSVGSANPGCDDGTSPSGRAADALVASGVAFTVAAGNAGHDECTVDGAAAAFDVVTVGAVDDRNTPDPMDDTLAGFSSAGPTTDGRLKPEVTAPGVNIRGVYVGPLIAQLSGTSMATPHAAGVLALLLEKEPGLTPDEAKARLIEGAVQPEAAPALPQEDWGHGVINACRTLALDGCTEA